MPRLLKRLAHDLARDAADLDVHLQSGNALARARHLEVHIPVVIFRARNVGQNRILLAFLHQPHRHASDGALGV